jgi:hypothetical protein
MDIAMMITRLLIAIWSAFAATIIVLKWHGGPKNRDVAHVGCQTDSIAKFLRDWRRRHPSDAI